MPARIWRVLRECGRTEKEVRVSETYGFLRRNYQLLEPSLPLTLLFIFARCKCACAHLFTFKDIPYFKAGAGESAAACRVRERRGPQRRCGAVAAPAGAAMGNCGFKEKDEGWRGVGVRDTGVVGREGVRGGALM